MSEDADEIIYVIVLSFLLLSMLFCCSCCFCYYIDFALFSLSFDEWMNIDVFHLLFLPEPCLDDAEEVEFRHVTIKPDKDFSDRYQIKEVLGK